MASTKIDEVGRKKIEALIRDAKQEARDGSASFLMETARLLEDLADVAEQYLKEMEHGKH